MTIPFANRLEFWDSRSTLGIAAGSGDINLKKLEINAIHKSLGRPSTVLDAGCGNGFTMISLAEKMGECCFFGFDYSIGMVKAGLETVREKKIGARVQICHGDLTKPPVDSLLSLGAPRAGFDVVYTERSIINLDSLEHQASSVQSLWELVSPGGKLVLCESFLDGLTEINFFRESIGLPRINPPWHNRYLSLDEIGSLLPSLDVRPDVIEFSGSYYFVSRVVHARDAFLNGKEPSYHSSLNIQSLDLPPLPVCGQSKIIVFSKP